ncbi:hypothetical protein [Paraflavitalea speifideaquila]|uniref:hypothetical protein n=1 Tax=Paraflavitalea speifideaquila TaxID=3076558 RepID=UPI0028E4944C|nr:hypothetical protein [Paraflavitalea speifideiaquila]
MPAVITITASALFGGGINFNDIIGTKTDFTSNYFYNRYNPKIEKQSQQDYFLPDGSTIKRQSNSLSDNINNSHKLNLSADIKLDSFHSIKISPSLGYQQTENSSVSDYSTHNQNGILANQGFSNSQTSSDGYNFRNDILFRKRFRTRGRTFSLSLQTNLNASDGDGTQLSVNKFYNPNGSLFRTDSIDQRNSSSNDLRSYNVRAVYTEPITKNSLLELSVGNSLSKSSSEKQPGIIIKRVANMMLLIKIFPIIMRIPMVIPMREFGGAVSLRNGILRLGPTGKRPSWKEVSLQVPKTA